jgi:LacI family transcriptional regulator
MVTMRDVAKKAGVSQATVSRVINESDYVDAETKQKVIRWIKELGYKSNSTARALARKESSLIGVILPNITNPYFGEVLSTIEHEAYINGYDIIFMESNDNTYKEKKCIENLLKRAPEGILIVPINRQEKHIQKLKEIDIPVVVITKIIEGFNAVAVSHRKGGELVAKHFVDLGHEEIAFIGNYDEKFYGFKEKLEEYGINFAGDKFFEIGKQTPASLRSIVTRKIEDYIEEKGKIDFTAIFATSDIIALEIIYVLREKGFKVPEDIAVAGFDNTFFARNIGITSVAQPISEISHIAFNSLLTRMTDRIEENEQIELLPRLIPRSSSVRLTKNKV